MTSLLIEPSNRDHFLMQTMPFKKLLGLIVMGVGIAWYSQIKLTEAPAYPAAAAEQNSGQDEERNRHSESRAKANEGGRGLPPLMPVEEQRRLRSPAWGGQIVSPRKGSHFVP
jgi:hypothetical protein